ncbi:MAG: TadE/TadG family type IV pilus assembly protein [Sphingorhabdus sp.]
MSVKTDAVKRPGFLSRLRSDQSGNTIAMFAAALFPLAGLIGGGLDMSRVYLVKTRLQAACDAGALAGRKQMGVGTWAASGGKANTEAVRMFNLNFAPDSYGTDSNPPTFTESSGSVTGTASATIPMTIMRIFGSSDSTVDVTCNAAMSIPNTDIMFVLDTTGSMASAPNGQTVTTSNPSKIAGLRKVAKCFYESLAKINIASVTPADCNETSDPSGGNVSGSQIRFGFVPYSSNVNVGGLFENDWMADSFAYQSRAAVLTPVWVYSLGSTSAISGWLNNWTPTTVPTSPYNTRESTSGWTDVTSGSVTTLQGSKPFQQTGATNSSNCTGSTYNNLSGSSNRLTGLSVTTGTPNSPTLLSTTQNPPVHPATQQVLSYNQTRNDTVVQYRYVWENRGSGNKCYLESRNHTTPWVKTQTGGTATTPITWTQYTDTFTNWEYRPVTHDVSGLKAGGSSWNTTVSLPTGYTTETLLVSGTNGVSYKRVVNSNVTWNGCIEERKTLRTDSWDPYPSATDSPDLDLNSEPTSDDDTKWKPSLNGGIWLRYSGSTQYYPTITSSSSLSTNTSYACPSAARLLTEYNDASGAASFGSYLDGLVATGSTYHDIGMIWGARLVLPDGIFSANNQIGSTNGIDRNIIFMTDGDTDSGGTANTAYGRPWWDRRQEVDTSVGPNETAVDTKINARFEAICDQLTNVENVTVWVVSFGGTGISNSTKTRLQQCATDTDHYFDAANTADLLTSFKAIASAISQLRLTN